MKFRLHSPPSTIHSTRLRQSNRRFRTSLILAALLLASCAPAAPTAPDAGQQPSVQEPASPVTVEPSVTSVPDQAEPPSDPAGTETAAPAPLPVATSRGPDLHATDPGTVSLASGQLQFVEFFRFT
jgi:hypothetical protein